MGGGGEGEGGVRGGEKKGRGRGLGILLVVPGTAAHCPFSHVRSGKDDRSGDERDWIRRAGRCEPWSREMTPCAASSESCRVETGHVGMGKCM